MGFEQLADGALVRVELAGASARAPRSEVTLGEPMTDGARIERQGAGDLGGVSSRQWS